MDDLVKQIDEEILESGKIVKLKPGQVVVHKNDPAKYLYYVREGSLLVLKDSTHFMVEKNSYLDPTALFNKSNYPFMAIAKEESELVCVSIDESTDFRKKQNILFLFIKRKSLTSEIKNTFFE